MVLFKDPLRSPTGVIPKIRHTFVVGGAAGNLTLAGIDALHDRLLSVQVLDLVEAAPPTWAVADLTSEFTITAANTINNTGGTATTGDLLIVEWEDHDYGETTEVAWQE